MRWYVSRAGKTEGPIDEATIVEWARNGQLPTGTMVRDEAGSPWTAIEQSPFAGYARPASTQRGPNVGARALLLFIGSIGLMYAVYAYTCHGIERTGKCTDAAYEAKQAAAVKDGTKARDARDRAKQFCDSKELSAIDHAFWENNVSTEPEPPAPPAPKPVEPVVNGPEGGWATVRRPGRELPDTAENRIAYMANVSAAHPGEPPLKKAAAQTVIEKLRRELAKTARVPISHIKVSLGDSAGAIGVDDGVQAHLQGEDYGVCSEAYLGSSLMGMTDSKGHDAKDQFAAAGVRAIICHSTGCAAAFDMRPTTTGGGVYGGDSCLDLADFMRKGLGQ